MASVNKIVLIGNLGADPEVRALPSGDSVANFSIATTDRRSNGNGGYVDATEWHRVALYGRQADVAGQYLKKGSQVYVEGKLRSGRWTDRGGVERRTWTVIADRMQMLGKPERRTSEGALASTDGMEWIEGLPVEVLPSDSKSNASSPDFDDDIPF